MRKIIARPIYSNIAVDFFLTKKQKWNFLLAMATAFTNNFKRMHSETAASRKSTYDGLVESWGIR